MIKTYLIVASSIVVAPLLAVAQSNDPEFLQALSLMYTAGLTQYATPDAYHPDDRLTREQAAKFFVGFQKARGSGSENIVSPDCTFSDIGQADVTLSEFIVQSCQLGLFKGTAGKFIPNAPFTKAQALTVLIRALDAASLDENTSPRWANYLVRARALGLTKEVDVWALDRPVTRYEIALLLSRAINGGINYEQQELDELKQILLQLGIRLQ